MEQNIVTSVMVILGYPQKLKSNDRACAEVDENVSTKNEKSLNKSALLQQRMKSKKNAKKRYMKEFRKARALVLKRDNWICVKCGKDKNLHVHHILPKSIGGTNGPGNLITLCGWCHAQEHPGEYWASKMMTQETR